MSKQKRSKRFAGPAEVRPLWVTLDDLRSIRRLCGDKLPASLARSMDEAEALFNDAALRFEEARAIAAANSFWEEPKTANEALAHPTKKAVREQVACLPAAEVLELLRAEEQLKLVQEQAKAEPRRLF